MTMLNETDVDVWTIIIGAGLAFGWGWFFYSERRAGRFFMEEMPAMKSSELPRLSLALEALYLLLLSWLVAVFYMLQMDYELVRGIGPIFAAIVIIRYFAAAAWVQRPMKLAALDSGYFVGCIVILLLTQLVSRMI